MKNMYFMDALGWMLVHSIWQIALIGLVLSIFLPRLHRTEQRYFAAYAALMAILVAGIATFGWYIAQVLPATEVPVFLLPQAAVPVHQVVTLPYMPSHWDNMLEWFEAHRSTIVLVWLVGFLCLLVRLLGGLWVLRGLRHKAMPLGAQWAYLSQLAEGVHVHKTVAILQTPWVHTPITFGWLKPVVLLPVALVNQLSPAEVEALVLHELAHIARRDWLMHLAQSLVEAVFYFHPVIWWLSSVIGQEREQCSDAKAIQAMPDNRLAYARALLQVQEYAHKRTRPALALAANGTPQPWFQRRALLLDRVQIILLQSTQQKKSMLMERMLISGLLLATCTFWGLKAAPKLPEFGAAATEWLTEMDPFQTAPAASDTLPPAKAKSVQRFSKEDDQQQVELELKDGQVSHLEIDGKIIPPADYLKYSDLVGELTSMPIPPMPPTPRFPPMPPTPGFSPIPPMPPMPPAPPAQGWGFSYSDGLAFPSGGQNITVDQSGKEKTVLRFDGETVTEVVVNNGKVFINGKEVKEGDQYKLQEYPAFAPEADMREHEAAMREHEAAMREHEADMREHDSDMREMEAEMRQLEAKKHRTAAQIELQVAKMAQDAATMQRAFPNAPLMPNDVGQVWLQEMKADGLVTDAKNYSYSISPKRMKVNGKKQSDSVHNKYLDLYRICTGRPMSKGDNISAEVSGR